MFIKVFFLFLILNSTIGFLQIWVDDAQSDAIGEGKIPVNLLYSTETNSSIGYEEGVDFANRTTFDDKIYTRGDAEGNGTLSGQVRNPANSSLAFGSADIFSEQSDIDAFEVWGFVKFFNGGFILDSMERMGGAIGLELPEGFVDSMAVVIGFIFILWMFFVITGRSFSSFT